MRDTEVQMGRCGGRFDLNGLRQFGDRQFVLPSSQIVRAITVVSTCLGVLRPAGGDALGSGIAYVKNGEKTHDNQGHMPKRRIL